MSDNPEQSKDLHELVQEKEKEHAPWRRLGYVGAGMIILLVAAGIAWLISHQVQSQIEKIKPNVAGGSSTCSGGNRSACDRVCIAVVARLKVTDEQGRELKASCHKSSVTSAIQSALNSGLGPQNPTATGSTTSSPTKTPTSSQPSDSGGAGGGVLPTKPTGGAENGSSGQSGGTPPNLPGVPPTSVCVENPLLPVCVNVNK